MMWTEVQVKIVVSLWSIFGISPCVEQGSGIITYIGIHMIAIYKFPPYINIFICYNDISVMMNSNIYIYQFQYFHEKLGILKCLAFSI